MSDFDPSKALAEARAAYTPGPANRLSFVDQCGLFCARKNAPRRILAAAFGVTKTTVSLIANCQRPGARYHRIAREVERLGEIEFDRRYYTDEIHTRIMRLKYDRTQPGDDRRSTAPNPLADKFAFHHHPLAVDDDWYRVDWLPAGENRPEGWYTTYCDQNGGLNKHSDPIGQEAFGDGLQPRTPFRTSAEAYDAAFTIQGLDSPRPKPGRPKAS